MSKNEKKSIGDFIALFLMFCSAAAFLIGVGFAIRHYGLYPQAFVDSAREGFEEIKAEVSEELPFWLKEVDETWNHRVRKTGEPYPGLNLITRVAARDALAVDVQDLDGQMIQSWSISWHELWPNASHLPADILPKNKLGTHVDGVEILEDGDLVFNFEHLGMMRLNPDGSVVWRLPYQTHHSIRYVDGYLWACGQRRKTYRDLDFPQRNVPYDEYTILKISTDGKIIEEWAVADILKDNGYSGLMSFSLQPTVDHSPLHRNDILHLNDVEPFPVGMEEGFFGRGDILVSLRNINTVFAFNETTGKIKYMSTGRYILQHDPDFLDGDTFSVFDNKHAVEGEYVSRIVVVNAAEGTYTTRFQGSEKVPFYTEFMGKHQWLPNGHLLVTESLNGRAIEVNQDGDVVWEYRNFIEQGIVALTEEVTRLPLNYRERWTE